MKSRLIIAFLCEQSTRRFVHAQARSAFLYEEREHQKPEVSPNKRLFSSPLASTPCRSTRARAFADEWELMKPRQIVNSYLQLSKSNLTALITLTAAGGYAMAAPEVSVSLGTCLVGTALLSAAANSLNQLLESPYDAQMKRTWSRLLVIHRFSPLRAATFAACSGVVGAGTLWIGCNPWTAILGILNLLLYVGVYTPLKRHHIACTWAGAVVGAIPPLMGYSAAAELAAPAFVIAAIVYCWQFPHFNGLSWNLRGDYSRAGYRVMCVVNEKLCRATSLRHTIALVPICSLAAPLSGLTTWTFAVDSLPLNLYFVYSVWRFYRTSDSSTSRSVFLYSLFYLPLIFLFMFLGRIEQVFRPRAQ